MEKGNDLKSWPLSNYPIFLALILLVVTTVTLSMGDEHKTEDFAIYTYYFLILGTVIRLFEFTFSGNLISKTINRTKSFLEEYRKIEQSLSYSVIQKYDYRTLIDKLAKKINQYVPIIIYLLVSLLVIINFSRYQLLDTMFLKNSLDNFYGFSSPIYGTNLFSSIIELDIISILLTQRIYLLLIIFLSGYSMHYLVGKILPSRIITIYS